MKKSEFLKFAVALIADVTAGKASDAVTFSDSPSFDRTGLETHVFTNLKHKIRNMLRNFRITRISILTPLVVGAMWLAQSANAALTFSDPLTLNSPNVVGTIDGITGNGGGNPMLETAFAQELINLGPNSGMVSETVDGSTTTFQTSSTRYTGTLTLGTTGGSDGLVSSGWEYAIAKYDGQNAGYVLFYLGGQAADLPLNSADIWVNGKDQGYGISGFTTFNMEQISVPVPESRGFGSFAGALAVLAFGLQGTHKMRGTKQVIS